MKNSFFRFLLVGVINTIVGLSFMYLFLHVFSCSYWASTFIGNVIGACVSYFLNRTFTFKSTTSMSKSMTRFAAVILLCYFISYYLGEKTVTILFAQIPFFEKKYVADAAVLFGTGFYTITNYLGQRLFVFQKRGNTEPILVNEEGGHQ
ncbi:GtrA family protein [Neobacillus sp. PS3-40]|uniref:GtrA family protein n=1 Tax=Neobacillus sp. PS3-40 TaxID=3070679 RepID=UPI0027DF030D|nr:GtrA family protein [Neobacillus sp. PS3-40]WML43467.1 GtrA family protein [Neobacillus sp. PS3-40]